MPITHSLTISYSTPAGNFNQTTVSYSGDTESNIDIICGNAATTQINVTYIKTNIQCIEFLSNVGGVTIRTNSNGSPQDTIVLPANKAIPWNIDLGLVYSCPFSNNVSTLFVTNTNASTALFQVRSVANN